MNIMFQQGYLGICYLIAGINAFNEIPSIFDQLFIDKYYSESKKEYKVNAFINSKMEIISLDDKFLYRMLGNNKVMYAGNQTYKYELFLKFIVKLFAELNKSKVKPDENETLYTLNKLKNIEGGRSSELYSCILGTSTLFFSLSEGYEKYIYNIEKYVNIPGNILATANISHQYAIKNMFEYFGKNGEKQKFITLFNPWGFGEPDKEQKYNNVEDFFENVQKDSKNYKYIYEFYNNYNKSGLIKVPLNLFCKNFREIEVCIPRYGFHYKVLSDNMKKNGRITTHLFCFYNDKKQNIEIELFLDELNNVRVFPDNEDELNNIRVIEENENDIEISLYKIEKDLNTSFIVKSLQSQSNFCVRKNAYIYKKLEEGNYLIAIKPIYFEKSEYEYNLRIGGEFHYLKCVSDDIFKSFKSKFDRCFQIQNISKYLIKSQYILLEKTYYDMKIYSIAEKMYNILYNPYEKEFDIEIKNGVQEIISIIKDAYNKKIYEITKNYATNKNQIKYLYNNLKQKLASDVFKTINKHELEILKIHQSLDDYAKNVEVIIRMPDNYSEKINLNQLKEIIAGPKIEKEKFYEEIRGYSIPQYGIDDDIDIDNNIKLKNDLKKMAFKIMQKAIGHENRLNESFCTMYINDNDDNEIVPHVPSVNCL